MSIIPKLLMACAIVIVSRSSEMITSKQPILTRTVKLMDRHSTTLAINSHLFTISHNKSHVSLDSTDINYASCIFAVSERLRDDRIRATVLGNKRKIVTWTVHYQHVSNETTLYASTKMLLIDPWLCNYEKIQLPSDYHLRWQIKNSMPGVQQEPQVITYKKTFDVILGGYGTYRWYKFNDEGQPIERLNKLIYETSNYFDAAYIQPVNLIGGLNGYLYVYKFANSTANVKLLDHNFNVRKYMRITELFLISYFRNKYAIINICYVTLRPYGAYRSPYIYRCDRLNSKLEAISTIYLPLPVESSLFDVSFTLDSLGNTFFTCCFDNSTNIILFHYDVNGRHVQTLDLNVSCGTTFIQHPLLLDGEYCFVNLKLLNTKKMEFLRVTNCIKVPKMRQHNSKYIF